VAQHVRARVEARRDLHERHAAALEAQDGALGHVEDLLAAPARVLAAEGDALDARDELADLAGRDDRQPAVRPRDPRALCVEGSAEDHLLRVLRDLDEPPGPIRLPPRWDTLTLPRASASPMPRNAMSMRAAVVIELLRSRDDGVGVRAAPKR